MDDDTLEQTVGMFGGPEYGTGGFGMSDILNEFMSRDPKFLPVSDLAQYQQNLKATGYLPPEYPVTGAWDDTSHAASRRSERDGLDLVRSGAHLGATTTGKFLEYLGKTVPQGVFEGVVGAAKGTLESAKTVAQNPLEAVEEAGVLGGAVVGGLAGSVIPGVGTLVGAGVGAVAGGLADLFDWGGEDEEDPEGIVNQLWDALSPYDEYKATGAKNFFALLDTAMVAAGAIKGATIGIKGVTSALRSQSLTQGSLGVTGAASAGGMTLPTLGSTRTVAQAGFRQAFKRAAPGTVDRGLLAGATSAALRRPVIGGAVIGGVVDAAPELLQGEWGQAAQDFGRGAVIGGATLGIGAKTKKGQQAIGKAQDLLSAAPLARITESGAGKVTRSIYTSLAVTSTTARITEDITPGEGPIGKGIKEAEELTESKVWDVMDLTVGAVMFPERMLALRPREVGDALRAMDNTHVLMPFIRAEAKHLKERITPDFIQTVRNKLGAHPVTGQYDKLTEHNNVKRMYLDRAIGAEAKRLAHQDVAPQEVAGVVGRYRLAAKEAEHRAKLIRQMKEEGERSPLAARLLEEGLDNQWGMQTHVETWQGRGTTIDNLVDEAQAQDVLDAAMSTRRAAVVGGPTGAVDEAAQTFRVMPAVKGQFVTQQAVHELRDAYSVASQEVVNAQKVLEGNKGSQLLQDQLTDAKAKLDSTLSDLRAKDLIDDDQFTALRPLGPEYEPDAKIIKQLDEIAEMRPVENMEMTAQLEQAGIDRYIAVNTGEDMLVTADIPRLMEYEGIGEVVRRPVREWFAAMARKPDDYHDLGPMRYWSIATSLDKTADELALGISGKQVTDRLYDFVRQRNDPEWAKANLGEMVTTGRTGTVIRRTDEEGIVRRELLKVDPRDLTANDVTKALKLDEMPNITNIDEAADKIKRSMAVGAAFGADMHHPLATVRELGRALGISGLPAFNDFARTARIPMHNWAKESRTGFFARAAKGSWGYLPQKIRNAHLAMQFSFSPTFDASRYIESLAFGARGRIPPRLVINPRKFIKNHEEGFLDPLTGERVFGGDALKAMDRFADEAVYGRSSMQNLDDLQYRVNNAGVLGFKPREVEAAQAFWLGQKYARKGRLSKADYDELRESVLTINRYGKGQSAWAKSTHFVFFPFLFQAKQLNLLQDVAFGAPTRTALIHEGMRRWNGINEDPGLKEDFEKNVVEKHFPVIRELARLNNLAYGIGAGRFMWEGLLDSTQANGRVALDKSTYGKITQGLTQFLLPGGIHSPVGESAGGLMDAARHIFSPVVIYDHAEQVTPWDEVRALTENMIPLYRDAERWFVGKGLSEGVVSDQASAIFGGGSPYHQFGNYLDSKKLVNDTFEEMAASLGYSSWASLKSSAAGAPLAQVEEKAKAGLMSEFPRGAELATRFVDTDGVKEQALVAIADKDSRTSAEEAILTLGTMEEDLKDVARANNMTQAEIFQRMTPLMRQLAMRFSEDRQFLNLYEQFFAKTYGPVRVVAA